MSLDVDSMSSAEPIGYDALGLRANWGEQVVTIAATSIALTIVALIAVLMGMA